jgi:hypothetical protein
VCGGERERFNPYYNIDITDPDVDHHIDIHHHYNDVHHDHHGAIERRPSLRVGRQLQHVLRYRYVDVLKHILGDIDGGYDPSRSDRRTYRSKSVE